ncbi:c-type cytochrome [Roseateles amylovorans]|uniref:C-type cytochrome n=1 Tax=Roseateles amylovorans TaxID=2978473 RepID=A0ABY6B1G9_9BURK|nr:c-type cytochrome [Roseateles amylovorans]UXH79242.1 c-type cytochrome [Roseateles amylovorans]
MDMTMWRFGAAALGLWMAAAAGATGAAADPGATGAAKAAGREALMRAAEPAPWSGPAEAASQTPPGSEAVRPLRPLRNDIGERVQACMLCHGEQGRATPDGYFPRLAGKPAGYLFNQLRHFRDGRRAHALMSGLLRHMTDDYLHEIAGYFAAQSLPYPPPVAIGLSPEDRRRAESLVRLGDPARRLPACADCHSAAMTGRQPAIPGLLGLPRDYLVAQLGAWRSGQRRANAPDCMADIARALKPDEIAAVASWLSIQPPGAEPAPPSSTPTALPCGGLSP